MTARPDRAGDGPEIRAVPRPRCPSCGNLGTLAIAAMVDRVFGSTGSWGLRRCSDASCDLLWLDPLPLVEDLPLLYLNYFTHATQEAPPGLRGELEGALRRAVLQARLGYDLGASRLWARSLSELSRLWPSGTDEFLGDAMFLPAPEHGARLLEIGCGSGEALARMRNLGWRVVGTDFDPESVATARRFDLDVRTGGVECVAAEEAGFDAIYLGHVIEHVPDPHALLCSCRDLLGPEGRLVVVTPNASSLGLRWFGADWRGLEPPRHLQLYTPGGLTAACHRARLVVDSVRTSAKGARYVLGTSLRIRDAAVLGRSIAPHSTRTKVSGLLLQLVERLAVTVSPTVGEEIILVANR